MPAQEFEVTHLTCLLANTTLSSKCLMVRIGGLTTSSKTILFNDSDNTDANFSEKMQTKINVDN